MDKSDRAYKTIGEVAKILKLQSNKKGILPTHIIRFWQKQFKQIKTKIFNTNRRYYDENCINLLKKVKFLLKDQGMTINGVKKLLNEKQSLKLDENLNNLINVNNFKIKNKLNNIINLIKELKKLK
jgi:DNA-binding transcriptional MerR regulator